MSLRPVLLPLMVVLAAASLARGEPRLLLRLVEECTGPASEPSPCLKAKLVAALDRAARSGELELLPGLRLVPSPGLSQSPPITENQLEAELPRALEDKEAALDELILDRIAAFFKSHSLQFKLAEIPRSLGIEEGRGRGKKKGAHTLLMMMFMMASMMLPLKMGTLAMLAGKALIISKLALALAAIVGLKKLLGHDEHQDSYQVVQVPAHGHKRSLDYLNLPYRAYQQAR